MTSLMAGRLNLKGFAWALQGPLAIGRLLLILAAISSLTMPLTQKIWTWDHFLHGGQDFESVTLAIVVILCFTVLLSQLCKRRIESFFAACRLLVSALSWRELAAVSLVGATVNSRLKPATGAAIGRFPLRI